MKRADPGGHFCTSAASSPYTGPVCFLRARLGFIAATTSSSTWTPSTSTATEGTAVSVAFLLRLAFLAAGVDGAAAGTSAAGCAAFALRRLAGFFPAGMSHALHRLVEADHSLFHVCNIQLREWTAAPLARQLLPFAAAAIRLERTGAEGGWHRPCLAGHHLQPCCQLMLPQQRQLCPTFCACSCPRCS